MRRVVVDRGVLVSAIITPRGAPVEIVRVLRDRRLALVASPHLLAELRGVLQCEKFRHYVTFVEVEQYVAGFASHAEAFRIPARGIRSRAIRMTNLIALARAAQVNSIVSGGEDLVVLEGIEPRILSPSSLVDELAREST